jgi:hypothetical protein
MIFSVTAIFTFIYKIVSVMTPMLNYLPQYFLMRRERSTGIFAKQICYILITANLLRITYWFGNHFELCLLLQSITILSMQLLLLYKFVQISHYHGNASKTLLVQEVTEKHQLFSKVMNQLFWTLFPLLWCYSIYLVVFLWMNNIVLTEFTGSLACVFDFILPIPQIINNWKYKSVKGLR